jgi:ribosomal protein S3AE
MADVNNRQAAKNAAKSAAELKKQKKKKWCPIVAPELFQNRVIGETLLDDASMLMNRTITVNMMQLFGDMKRQNVSIMFKVTDVKEGKGLCIPVKYVVAQSSLRRLAKREKDKLSDSFVVKTADGKLVRIKPVMITNNQTKGSVQTALLRNCRVACKELINTLQFENIFVDLISGRLQKDIKEKLHKVYPLRIFDIRTFELETRKKKESVEEGELLRIKQEKAAQEAEKLEAEESQTEPNKPEQSSAQFEDSDDSDADESDGLDSDEESDDTDSNEAKPESEDTDD